MWKIYIWNPEICNYDNGKYVGSFIGDSVAIKKSKEETKPLSAKGNSTKAAIRKCTSTNFYILLAFLLITIELLIAASIYCYLITYQAKKPFMNLPLHH